MDQQGTKFELLASASRAVAEIKQITAALKEADTAAKQLAVSLSNSGPRSASGASMGSGGGRSGSASAVGGMTQQEREALNRQFQAQVEKSAHIYESTIDRLRQRHGQLLQDLGRQPNLKGYERYRSMLEGIATQIDRLSNRSMSNVNKSILSEVTSEKSFDKLMERNASQMAAFEAQSRAANKSLTDFNTKLGEAGSKVKGTSALVSELTDTFKHMAMSFVAFRVFELIVGGAGAAAEKMNQAVESAAKLDRYRRSFTALLGEGGGQNLGELMAFTRQTPFDLEQSIALSQRLIATGMQWKQVLPTMYAASNAIARIGGSNEQMQMLVKALTDVQAKGKLAGQEVIQFGNAGVNIISVLAEQLGKTRAEVLALSEDGQISGELVIRAFRNWSREQGDFLGQQANDYLGIQQNLEDVRFELEAAFGESAMRKRAEAGRLLLDVYSDPKTLAAAKEWGNTFGQGQGYFDSLQALMTALGSNSGMSNVADYALFGGLFGKFEQNSKEIQKILKFLGYEAEEQTAVTDAVKGTHEALDGLLLAEQDHKQAIDDRIDALRRELDIMQQQRSLREQMAGIAKTERDLQEAQRYRFDFYSGTGRRYRESIPDLQEQLSNKQGDLSYLTYRQGVEELIYGLQQQAASGPPLPLQHPPGPPVQGPPKPPDFYITGGFAGGQRAGLVGFCLNCSTTIINDVVSNSLRP